MAQKAADRAVQYLAKQRKLLRAAGESPTHEQRAVEKDHQDWTYNVRRHAESSPLHIPPVCYQSTPLTEQDVVGLFNQLAALGVFPGIHVSATSQSKTYDALVSFKCDANLPGIRYESLEKHPLGLSPYVLGESEVFETADLTLEFKNNLDALIEDVEGKSKKNFAHIDVCVCWSTVSDSFPGFHAEEITELTLDRRLYPGVTHLLTRDNDMHSVQVIQLKTVVDLILSGRISVEGG